MVAEKTQAEVLATISEEEKKEIYMHVHTGSVDTREGWVFFDEESGMWIDAVSDEVHGEHLVQIEKKKKKMVAATIENANVTIFKKAIQAEKERQKMIRAEKKRMVQTETLEQKLARYERTFKSTCKAATVIFGNIFEYSDEDLEHNLRECRMHLSAQKLVEATVDGLKEVGIVKKSLSSRQLHTLALRASKYAALFLKVKQKSSLQ